MCASDTSLSFTVLHVAAMHVEIWWFGHKVFCLDWLLALTGCLPPLGVVSWPGHVSLAKQTWRTCWRHLIMVHKGFQ